LDSMWTEKMKKSNQWPFIVAQAFHGQQNVQMSWWNIHVNNRYYFYYVNIIYDLISACIYFKYQNYNKMKYGSHWVWKTNYLNKLKKNNTKEEK